MDEMLTLQEKIAELLSANNQALRMIAEDASHGQVERLSLIQAMAKKQMERNAAEIKLLRRPR